MSLLNAKASRGGVDIKPPSLPSNIEKIYDVRLWEYFLTSKGTTENGPIFNREGFYTDLQTRLEEQQVPKS